MATLLPAPDETYAQALVALASLDSMDTATPIIVAPENIDDYTGTKTFPIVR